jgi:hypothetical protein
MTRTSTRARVGASSAKPSSSVSPILGHDARAHRDGATGRRELDRVVARLMNTWRSARDRRAARELGAVSSFSVTPFLRAVGVKRRDHLASTASIASGLRFAMLHGAALELAQIEQAHDEREELLALLVDGLDELLLLGR